MAQQSSNDQLESCSSTETNVPSRSSLISDDPPPRAKRPRRSILCPHCNQHVSKSTYYRHKADFYNKQADEWSKDYQCRARAMEHSTDSDTSTLSECDGKSPKVDLDINYKDPTDLDEVSLSGKANAIKIVYVDMASR